MAHNPKADEQERAETEVDDFRRKLGPFVVAAEKTRMAMVFTDAEAEGHPIIFANDAFLKLTGYGREEVLGNSFDEVMAAGAEPEALEELEAAFDGSTANDPVIRYRRRDGSEFWASVFVSPVCDETGAVVQHFASFANESKHRVEQASAKMLIDELNHRVKNTLSTVQSITRQALRNAADPAAIRESIESRIFALSRSHDLLSRKSWAGVGLHDLIEAAMEPFGVINGRKERFTIDGCNVRLPPKATLALGIALNELATNAVKYGAFSNEAGSIAISWTIEPSADGERLILCWHEKDGPPVSAPTRRGFGSQVMERGLAHELDGKVSLEYRPGGVVCSIDIPAPADAAGG